MALQEKRQGQTKIKKNFVFDKQDLLRSMMNEILAFNGEDEVMLGKEKARDLAMDKPGELIELFQCTAVYLDVIRALDQSGPLSTERKKRIEQGYRALADVMVETFGFDAAGLIIADTHNAINLEKLRQGNG
jgi:hypothetical protein